MPLEMLGTSPRHLSPAVRAGDFVFVSGQLPTEAPGRVVEGGIEPQTRQVFENLREALALAGCTLPDVCKVTVWLQDAADFAGFNRVYAEAFGEHKPARSTVQAQLMIDARVEIEVTAFKPVSRAAPTPA